MYIEIHSPTNFKSFDNVNEVIFHSSNGDMSYTNTDCINHDEKYTSLRIIQSNREILLNKQWRITKVVR